MFEGEQPSHKLVRMWMAAAGLLKWSSGRFGPFGVHEGGSSRCVPSGMIWFGILDNGFPEREGEGGSHDEQTGGRLVSVSAFIICRRLKSEFAEFSGSVMFCGRVR